MVLSALTELVPPPAWPTPASASFASAAVSFDDGLAAVLEAYGTGAFEDEVWLVEPREVDASEFGDWSDHDWTGLVIWGQTANGYWLCRRSADRVMIVADPRGDGQEEHPGLSCLGLLVSWVRGTLAGSILGTPVCVRDGIPSWFTATEPAPLEHVEHRLSTGAPAEVGAAADVVVALLGSVEPRSGRAGPQVKVVTERGWRVMYDCAYGHRIRVTYPPADAPLVEEFLLRADDALREF